MVALLLNPAVIAGLLLAVAVLRFSATATTTAGDTSATVSSVDRLARRAEALVVVQEFVVGGWIRTFTRKGLFIAFWVLRGHLAADRSGLGLNATGSPEAERKRIGQLSVRTSLEVTSDFVIAVSRSDGDAIDAAKARLASVVECDPLHVSVIAAASDDGGSFVGYLSTLNAFHLSTILLAMPPDQALTARTALESLGLSVGLGWLAQRFVQAAIVQTMRDLRGADAIRRSLRPKVVAATASLSEQPAWEDRQRIQWEIRRGLIHRWGHFVEPPRLARLLGVATL